MDVLDICLSGVLIALLIQRLHRWAVEHKPTPKTTGNLRFTLTPAALQRYDDLVTKAGAENRAELLRWALQSYEVLITRVVDDGEHIYGGHSMDDLSCEIGVPMATPPTYPASKPCHLRLVESPDDEEPK